MKQLEMAKREILLERGGDASLLDVKPPIKKEEVEEEQVTKYSRASAELVAAREIFAKYSFSMVSN